MSYLRPTREADAAMLRVADKRASVVYAMLWPAPDAYPRSNAAAIAYLLRCKAKADVSGFQPERVALCEQALADYQR